MKLGPLLLCDILEFSYDELIGNRKFHTRITRDKYKDSKVRQELYRANQYEKPRQDAGVFIILIFKSELDGHPEYELASLQDQSDSDGLVPSFAGFWH
jgi:hypothetical protein